MDQRRRRKRLGKHKSAALPLLWAVCRRKGWTHAELARQLDVSSAYVSGLLFGEFGPFGRVGGRVVERCKDLGVPSKLWEAECPDGWRPWGDSDGKAPTPTRSRHAAKGGTDARS